MHTPSWRLICQSACLVYPITIYCPLILIFCPSGNTATDIARRTESNCRFSWYQDNHPKGPASQGSTFPTLKSNQLFIMNSEVMNPFNFQSRAALNSAVPHVTSQEDRDHAVGSRKSVQIGGAFEPYIRANDSSNYGEENDTSTEMEEDDFQAPVVPTSGGIFSPITPQQVAEPPCPPPVSAKRPTLDKQVGANTPQIYLKMRELQRRNRPTFQPDSPYVKYRR